MKLPRAGMLIFVALFMLAAGSPAWADGSGGSGHWVGTWACSPMVPNPPDRVPAPGLAGATLRQVVRVSIGGKRIRLRLSNEFGNGPLSFVAVHLAGRPVLFHGSPGATIPAGAPLVSDPLDLDLAPLSDVPITIAFTDVPKEITSHPGSRATSFLDAGGRTIKTVHWYVISGIDVFDDEPGRPLDVARDLHPEATTPAGAAGAIAVLGDSITDGRGSTTDGNDRWTDDLARRLQENPETARTGILNEAMGGNRLLHDGLGPNALARFDRDIIAQTGVHWVIVFEGVNDLGSGAKPRDIIDAYEQCIVRAHAHGLRIYGATITPFGGTKAYRTPPSEAARQAVNVWIRQSGHFDGVIDFDAAVRDPSRPTALDPEYDTGDHLHLNPAGYRHMAEAVDLALFAPRPLVSPLFADHMVLQRNRPATLWGWTDPGQRVEITFAGNRAEAVGGPDGRWQAEVATPPAGGPYELRVEADQTRTLRDVLVGDVWLCGGQSNMEFALKDATDGPREIRSADLPTLRLCTVKDRVAYAPASSVPCTWAVCSPASVPNFSAVGYFFGRRLVTDLHVPIGLIQDCVGGSPAESWIGAETLGKLGLFADQRAKIAELHAQGGPEYGSFLMHWLDRYDRGGRGNAWAQPDFDDRAWSSVTVPQTAFSEPGVGTDPAVVWFRRDIDLPSPLPAGAARIELGVIERMETIFVNGRWVGASSWVEHPRVYPMPADALKPGKNVLAVRVYRTKPNGGFLSPAADLRIRLGDGRVIPLAGTWRAAVSVVQRPPVPAPLDLDNYATMPTVLYNGMIAPLEPLSLEGVIWYQGAGNAWRPAEQYRTLLTALIGEWRERFGDGAFPFYIVQLPAFLARRTDPGGTDGWSELRGAQAEVARTVPGAALAVTVDTGSAENLHPPDKQPVGERLALCALAGAYGRPVVSSGPTVRTIRAGADGALTIVFDHADGGLTVKGATLGEFSVQAADGSWHWAKARIAGSDSVVVTAQGVTEPSVVRYAWQANPLATLYNAAGLPAVPFQEKVER